MGSLVLRVALGAGLAAATMLSGPAMVEAQPAPSAADKAAAKKLVDDANAAFEAKDYDKAIELYQSAYQRISHPELMFNIAQAHRLAGRPDKAAPFYERYLQYPNVREAKAAREHLDAINAAAAKSGTAPRPAETRPAEVSQPGDAGKTGELGPATAPTSGDTPGSGAASAFRAPVPDEPPRTDEPARPGQALRTTGLVLGGIGLASIAVGGYFTTRVLAAEDDAAAIAQMGGSLDEVKQRGDAAQRNGDIAYIIGGGLVLGGVVTYFVGYRKGRDVPTTAFTPIVRPDFAGVALSGLLP